jgi:phenylpropionate dioxygenase-like ring-hydroxylating dioxygenase large terminal subunit
LDADAPFLNRLWYFAVPARDLKRGAMVSRVIAGHPVVLWRDETGRACAVRDLCPHRGVPLSCGRLAEGGREVECPYHGWRFGADGACTAIPSLTSSQTVDIGKIRVRRYPVTEQQGLIWLWLSDAPVDGPAMALDETPAFDAPLAPGFGADAAPKLVFSMDFDCHIDHAVIGLMDPAHGPYVHGAWWWRSRRSMHDKAKRFGPVERGFSMLAHAPSSNSFAYKLLGGKPTTEIVFTLPGVRTELIRTGKRQVCALTAVTPVDEQTTRVTQIFWWDMALMSVMKPVLAPFARAFLKQDRDMVEMQREGLKHNPRLMLINDSDTQAKWYFRLKQAWIDHCAGGEFRHPLTKDVTLHWRS